MFGRLPFVHLTPRWVPFAHRWTGTAAFLVSLPVAYHCLWSLGFETTSPRVVIHGIAGCLFYGAFTTKLLALRSRRLPGWALPVIGGTLVAGLVDHLDDVGAVVLQHRRLLRLPLTGRGPRGAGATRVGSHPA